MAFVLAVLLAIVQGRAAGHLDAAGRALAAGDATAAARALALAEIYVDSRLWDASWPLGERVAARARERALAGRLLALRAIEERLPMVDAARRALAEAHRASRPNGARYAPAREAAARCGAPIPDGADPDWQGPRGSLAALLAECGQISRDALAGAERAAADAAARDRAFRSILHGDRLLVYERHGEPTEPDLGGAATAPTWTYVEGPTGPLRHVVRLIFTFHGDKLVGRRRTRHAR